MHIKAFLSHRGNIHRLFIAKVVAVGSQCYGSGLINAYLPQILNGVGQTIKKERTVVNGIINVWTWVMELAAGWVIPKLSKRVLFLFSTIRITLVFVVLTALSEKCKRNNSKAYGIGVVAMMFVYNGFYGTFDIPLYTAVRC